MYFKFLLIINLFIKKSILKVIGKFISNIYLIFEEAFLLKNNAQII